MNTNQRGICLSKSWLYAIFICVLLNSCESLNSDQAPPLVASFSVSPANPVAGQPVQFTDTSTGSPSRWEWTFGDGTVSKVQNPNHSFSSAGSYSVNLTVSKGTESHSTNRPISVEPVASGSVYYVDTAHASANDSNPGTNVLPWKTIAKANQTLLAGDTVYIKAGTYASYIAPTRSGTTSTRITYRAYGSDVVTVQNASYGILLDGKSYITVHGINFYSLDRFLWLQNGANHNIISYCNFDQGLTVGWSGSKVYRSSSFNWVHHCRFSKYGYYTSNDIGCLLDIGNEETKTDMTGQNIVENNTMFHGGHHVIGIYGMHNVIRNNYFHNEPWSMGTTTADRGAILYGNRNLSVAGYPENSGRNLIEGNQIAYSADPPDNFGSSGMALTTQHNIIRNNKFYYNDLSGISMAPYVQDVAFNKIYNNTFFRNANSRNVTESSYMMSAAYMAVGGGGYIVKFNSFINNLFYRHPRAFGTYNVSLLDQTIANNWEGDSQGNPQFVSASETLGDPMNSSLPDLRLQSNSPCRDAGTYLTTITSLDGTGGAFSVADAGFFMDGWGIPGIQGDQIQIIGTSQKALITNVNYATNIITVNSTLTWTQGQGIALAYVGSAPDIGAFEYGSQSASGKK